MKHIIIGTAGHVDHGKTALIKALTGRETDRLREEKQRGISIELGFAPFDLPSGRQAGVVDVPGHERFIHHMLAGVSGFDLVLFVVAADEGVMPQTREHLDILNLLGIKKGIVVLTKKDLVEEEWLELVTEEVKETLAGTFLAEAPLYPVSSITGAGIPQLLTAIDELTQEVEGKDLSISFRLPIDRVFTITGFGTVVTGTLVAGTIRTGDKCDIVPGEKQGRVRQLQVHGREVKEAYAGQRVAVNISGIDLDDISRGDVLAAPGSLRESTMVDCRLYLLESAPRPLTHRARIRFHVGTAEVLGRVYLLDSEELAPGDTALVQFRLEAPVAVRRGDRYVIRSYSPAVTIGGGMLIEGTPPRRKRYKKNVIAELELKERGNPAQLVEQGILEAGIEGIGKQDLGRKLGLPSEELEQLLAGLLEDKIMKFNLDAPYYLHRSLYKKIQEQVEERLAQFHHRFPFRWGMAKEELRTKDFPKLAPRFFQEILQALAADRVIELERDKLKLSSHRISYTPAQEAIKAKLAAAFLDEPFVPPSLGDVLASIPDQEAEQILLAMMDAGILIKVAEDIIFHRQALETAQAKLQDYIQTTGSITVSELRDLLQTSRRYALPLLEYFDTQRLTKRVGDRRVLVDKG
ncbi:MAG: selenocysteine-specific translation elongation factor [bacterium]